MAISIGTVKWFNNAKGYGFIRPEEGGADLFAHFSSVEMDGYKTLKAGQMVTFEVQEGPKGLYAANITLQDEQESLFDHSLHQDPMAPSEAPAYTIAEEEMAE